MADNPDQEANLPSGAAPRPQYYLAGGVRRAVAAREAGCVNIAATIVNPGNPDVLTRIALDQLHSPKDSIPRDARYLRIEIATRAGMIVVPIEVQPLGLGGQVPTVPLAQVRLQ